MGLNAIYPLLYHSPAAIYGFTHSPLLRSHFVRSPTPLSLQFNRGQVKNMVHTGEVGECTHTRESGF